MGKVSDMLRCVIHGCFFFQAEDGIRDLVRSRGLGDVYKRQLQLQGLALGQPGGHLAMSANLVVATAPGDAISRLSLIHI